MKFDLGVDAGGSRSDWVLVDEHDVVVHRGAGAAIQAAALDPTAVALQLRGVLHAATEAAGGVHPVSLVVGLSGARRPTARAAIRKALALPFPVAISGEVEVAAASCVHEGPGLAVWAGTSSFAVARDADGRLHRVGGRGWLLDDRGSGYAIVRAAAAAVIEAADGVGPKTSLTQGLTAAFDVPEARNLGSVLQRAWPGDVAAEFPEVLAAADDGDLVANRVLRDEGRALAARAAAATRGAMFAEEEAPVWFGGSVFGESKCFAEILRDALGEAGFTQEPRFGAEPALGAARLARSLRDQRRPLCSWVDDEHAA